MSDPVEPVLYNLEQWLTENQQYFLPPVCNKMLHQRGQMKSFFVGGPNQRKDYHVDCGEELFYMRKGNMVLKVVEQGKHRDVVIKEGELFLLPACIPHSPQRIENTIGLVLERERHDTELDGLKYFIEDDEGKPTLDSLYEEWFHCEDLGVQLGPIIKKFFDSEQCKTGKPLPGTIPDKSPVELDTKTKLRDPFNFNSWIKEHRDEIETSGKVQIFDAHHQFQVFMYGNGTNSDMSDIAETWIWQWEGNSQVAIEGKTFKLSADDNLLVPVNQRFTVTQDKNSLCLVAYQDPTKCNTWPA